MVTVAVPRARSGEWLPAPGFGVYIHVPFCLHRCHYCDFNTYEGQSALHAPYARALAKDIARWSGEAPQVSSIFFGGGTPTLLSTADLGLLLEAIRDRFEVASDAEITIEANPETVDEERFAALLDLSFNRFSIGIQSLQPRVLEGLGRRHSSETALAALAAARRAGASDVNADLIYGSPWERAEDWVRSLEGIIEVEPEHVSAYALTVEEHTPLATLVATGRVAGVDPDIQAERYELACELLGAASYGRYEISNWSKPDHASRHNLLYWSAGDYAGLGAGAHEHAGGRRSWRIRLPRDYVAAVSEGRSTEAGSEHLSPEKRAGEALVLGLRLRSGIDLDSFSGIHGADQLDERLPHIRDCERLGLLSTSSGRLRLTPRGTLVASDVSCRLL